MKHLLIVPALILFMSCGNQKKETMSKSTENFTEKKVKSAIPKADDFVNSPLRNRIELELNAPVNEVWSLVGKLERMPEYSSGLKKLEVNYDENNNCTDYTCYFFPMVEGGEVTTHSESIKWYAPKIGYASTAHEPNLGGLKNTIGIITLKEKGENTILKWDVHFNAENNEMLLMNIAGFNQALNDDISKNLIKIFGGKVLKSFVQEL